jgi:formate hydrogenlyase subunit 3/multisubunit Na+/H+ antiporter MnhD subunit
MGAQLGAGWLAVLIASSMLALIAYVRALTRMWWGVYPAEDSVGLAPAVETGTAKTCIVILGALLVLAGVAPSMLRILTWGAR